MKSNINSQTLWGSKGVPDLNKAFQSCMGFTRTPGFALIYHKIIDTFQTFENLDVIELGCGIGKVSLLFSLLGAKITLVDYSDKQLFAAKYIHEHFHLNPRVIKGNILNISEELRGQYDVAMSFGTAEHFWGDERQAVFNNHAEVLRKGGYAFLWVPNRWGFLFHTGRLVRKLLGRSICPIDETPFTRKELLFRAKKAGLTETQIKGGSRLIDDFNGFIIDFSKLFGTSTKCDLPADVDCAKKMLFESMRTNSIKIMFLNDLFSYPLVLTGYRS